MRRYYHSLFLIIFVSFLLEGCLPKRDAPQRHAPQKVIPKKEPLSKYGNPISYKVDGKEYFILHDTDNYYEEGIASWYGPNFHGERTSSGEVYDMYEISAAHKTLPIPTYAEVTNLKNNRSIIVRINDRGPFVKDRLIDLSYAAAKELDVIKNGTAPVSVKAISFNENNDKKNQAIKIFLQLGVFSNKDNIKRMSKLLNDNNYGNFNIQETDDKSSCRVILGPYNNRNEAERVIQDLKQIGIMETKIILEH